MCTLTLAHAHALGMMVSRLTLGKEKWLEGHDFARKVIESSTEGIKRALCHLLMKMLLHLMPL